MSKKKSKKKKLRPDGFELVDNTVGKICAGVFVHYERQELKIKFATGEILRFKPIGDE